MIAVTILGNNSASPAHGRHPTAQIVQTHDHTFLVDCGEGTQLQLNKYKVKRSRINHIFISHLHGDHYFGLIGLINTFALNSRETDLHIYAPEGLQPIIDIQLSTAHSTLPYTLHFHTVSGSAEIFNDGKMQVSSFEVCHRIPCFGFVFREIRNPRKLDIEKVQQHHVPHDFYQELQLGKDYITPQGIVVPNATLTTEGSHAASYAYCADTAYTESICPHIRDVDMVYHETTYLAEHDEKATQRFHSTTLHAAAIAQKAGAKKLLIGHYSSRYEDIRVFEQEARTIFPETQASQEGVTYIV